MLPNEARVSRIGLAIDQHREFCSNSGNVFAEAIESPLAAFSTTVYPGTVGLRHLNETAACRTQECPHWQPKYCVSVKKARLALRNELNVGPFVGAQSGQYSGAMWAS
jgi:hypothetical protein